MTMFLMDDTVVKSIRMRKGSFVFTVMLLLGILLSGCSQPKSMLTINNWPYSGSGGIAINIYDDPEGSLDIDAMKAKLRNDPNRRSKDQPKLSRKERKERMMELLTDALENGTPPENRKQGPKNVATHMAYFLNSPFKLTADNGAGWLGNGSFAIRITISGGDNTTIRLGMSNVVFTNGSATIDYNSLAVMR